MSHKLLGGSDQHGRNPVASPYGIAARRLTLTGGADPVGVRMPGAVVVGQPRGQHLPDRGQATLTGGADRVGVRMPDRGSASLRLATA